MKKLNLTMAAMVSFAMLTANAEKIVIYHDWSSDSEVAALNILKSAFEDKGHVWKDVAIAHDTGSNVNLMSLVTGGKPPNVFLEPNPATYRQLKTMGLSRPLNEFYESNNIADHFPMAVRDAITVDGDMVKIPVGIHIDGMMYYSKAVAAELRIDPEAWDDLDTMYADFEKIQAAGKIPLAIGAQQWQIGYLTHALAAAVGGADFYNDIYGPEPSMKAIESDNMRITLEWLRKFQAVADEGSVNRDWNMTTAQVMNGDALMQIHGDWMKGEWRAAGKVAGTDYGCVKIPGAKAIVVTVDGFGLLGGQPENIDAAELDFASIATDAEINAEFASVKGATPVRLDAPESALDICSTTVLSYLADENSQVINPHSQVDADWQGSLWDVLFNFWSDPSMSVDDAMSQIKSNYETIL